jgi:hypothetical protein
MGGTALLDFRAQVCEYNLNPKGDWNRFAAFFRWRLQVFPIVKIELLDRRKPVEPVRAKGEIESLTKSAFADVVRTHEERMPVKLQFSRLNAAKMFKL